MGADLRHCLEQQMQPLAPIEVSGIDQNRRLRAQLQLFAQLCNLVRIRLTKRLVKRDIRDLGNSRTWAFPPNQCRQVRCYCDGAMGSGEGHAAHPCRRCRQRSTKPRSLRAELLTDVGIEINNRRNSKGACDWHSEKRTFLKGMHRQKSMPAKKDQQLGRDQQVVKQLTSRKTHRHAANIRYRSHPVAS